MAKIKYHLRSATELVLDEAAQAGDLIDLKDEQKIDTAGLSDELNRDFEQRLAQQKKIWQEEQAPIIEAQKGQVQKDEHLKALEIQGQQKEKIALLEAQIKNIQENTETKVKEAISQNELAHNQALTTKDQQITALEKDMIQIKSELANQAKTQELEVVTVKNDYEAKLKAANEQVEFYKDFKARQSTKEIGESLEEYAHQEFNKIRPYAFPNAYFEKDNEVSRQSGSKGDFIFRDYQNGLEFISIMFDMKNEADTTAAKHKNADFFKELDKDRREKKTEYAVLVSMLEADSDYYNTGIVQVSDYEKMYVIRPQFFIQFIGILRNAALNSVSYQQELAAMREQNLDITHFEDNIEKFKVGFSKNYTSYSKNVQEALKSIDKSIARMEDVKKQLTTSENQLRLANNKLDDVSVKKLTRGNPTMQAKFASLKSQEER
ncbi:DUF2130 domain-containing protein [Convivina intestini]|uniref:DUF2130 domain-containing protein n=1 Tax=Convivina intestini TaxID=1505726 RepID=A0A2U1DEP1_9LACO|nr:DUF2130 domain-containing protein [Convivina intestini]PVY86153.1 hypothetical protein C7384_10166 [Convivina intestini]CAH1851418.1 hypothetical protein R077811_00345 [Convivina intestini]CAH1852941.1 hypothetical protein R078131_00582 [Convivina intestini]SDB81107.1 hypothetical protein SAMN05216341_10158 [Leuconostocaceae bacterium R-53105]